MKKKYKATFKKRSVPKVYKSAFGGYYVLTEELFTQNELQEAYQLQQKDEPSVVIGGGETV